MTATTFALHAAQPLADDGLFGVVNGLTGEATTAIIGFASLLAIVFVLRHIMESFTITRLLTALILAGVMVWSVTHLSDLASQTDKTVKHHESMPAVLVIPDRHPGA
jgi:hypothetical protein